MRKKSYLSPAIKEFIMVTEPLLEGTATTEGDITDTPATEPALSGSLDMDLDEDGGQRAHSVWED